MDDGPHERLAATLAEVEGKASTYQIGMMARHQDGLNRAAMIYAHGTSKYLTRLACRLAKQSEPVSRVTRDRSVRIRLRGQRQSRSRAAAAAPYICSNAGRH